MIIVTFQRQAENKIKQQFGLKRVEMRLSQR